MSMISSYFSYQNQYVDKYGSKTIVFMEVGSFFEIYGAENQVGGDIIHTIARLLNLHVSKKNGKNKKNSPYMAGFPTYALDKYVKILLQEDFTVVVMEQEKVEGHKRLERKVTRIISPGTDIEHIQSFHSNTLVSVFVEIVHQVQGTKRLFLCGLTTIDVTTGKSTCTEFCIPFQKIGFALAQLTERLFSINPNELLWSKPKKTDKDEKNYLQIEDYLRKRGCLIHRQEPINDLTIQQHILETIFPNHGMLSVFEYVGLNNNAHICQSFVQLMSFVKTHCTIALHSIPKPSFTTYSKQCILTSTTLDQLKIIHTRNNKSTTEPSLFQIINKCSTAGGKRSLYHRLTHPIHDEIQLNKRYNGISQLLKPSNAKIMDNKVNTVLWKKVESYLENIVDIERLHRRIQMSKIRPSEFASFWVSYMEIHKLLRFLTTSKDIDMSIYSSVLPDISQLTKCTKELSDTLVLEKIAVHTFDTIDESVFIQGVYPHIDSLQTEYNTKKEEIEQWRQTYSDLIDPTKTTVRLISNDRDGTYLSLTKKRYVILKEKLDTTSTLSSTLPKLSSLTVVHGKHDIKLKGGPLRKNSDDCNRLLIELRTEVCQRFINYMTELCKQYDNVFYTVSDFVAEMDVMKCGAKVAMLNGYTRPHVQNNKGSTSSYVQVTGIRHPIIERIQDDVPYITNDIDLGIHRPNSAQGILLYGVNAAGKSSLMKAIGVNLIMAQAGLYVAADHFNYRPYQQIFTRLTKEDNLYEGLSSFAVEMTELRNILLRANEFSLVLGDELCSGTESISALAIVSAGIHQLHSCGTTYCFATHLHKLSDIPLLNQLPRLRKYHLSVSFEPSTGVLRYGRKLSPGIGSSLYGLEVCKGMDMPVEFMNIASDVRISLCPTEINRDKSKYNAKCIKYKCAVCSAPAIDTHHIQFQKDANSHDMIGHIHKNRRSNLVELCETCHTAVHNDTLIIHGWQQSTNGRHLEYTWQDKKTEKKKFNQDHIDWIFSKHVSAINTHVLKLLFESTFNISISTNTLSKIRNGKY